MNLRIVAFLAVSGLKEIFFSTGLLIVAIAIGIGFQVPSTSNLQGFRAELLAQWMLTSRARLFSATGIPVLVTHDSDVADRCSRRLVVSDVRLVQQP